MPTAFVLLSTRTGTETDVLDDLRGIKNVDEVCKMGDLIPVKLLAIDDQGRLRLSRKAALAETGAKDKKPEAKDSKPVAQDQKPAGPQQKSDNSA